ncbi:serine carboxypeptidase-like 7 isoform X1 [Morus notabilis]|uniref:serine carboxypeptidase-like 7 isoform X1 n=1 Tax=Morus notabilis TaxID=981085 RepID=UPI000CED0CF4|nr:serine carboxypeptidase-like 7 isoform X1 [Morus notabilis]
MDTIRHFTKVFKCTYIHLFIYCLILFSDSVVPSSSIVKSLPGFPGPLPFNLETGYIAVDEKEDVQFFYYFVESEGSPRDDPLMLWFTGGPFCSGFSSLAIGIGPILFNKIEYNGSLPTLTLNPNSWTKAASIIFIDAPAGSGFSYSRSLEGYQTGELLLAHQIFNFLKKWLLSHPKFISNPLYLGGQSYGGIIIPLVAQEVAKSIEAGHTPKFNFRGYLLGNPLTDLNIDWNSNVSFAHRMGLIPDELYEAVKITCKEQYRGNYDKNSSCANNLNAILHCTEKLNDQHILEPKCTTYTANGKTEFINRKSLLEKPSPDFPEFECRLIIGQFLLKSYNSLLIHSWANNEAVQRALHIQKGTIETWIRCPDNVPHKFQATSVILYHQHLHSRGYKALIYSGDHDMLVPYIGTQTWIKSLNIPIVSTWRPWLVNDQIAGYVTEYSGGLTFATVKGGGHTAPEYRPKECFSMFKRWISNHFE